MTSTPFDNPPLPAEPTLAITSCDSFEGQTLALYLADHLEKKLKKTFIATSTALGGSDTDKPRPPIPEPTSVTPQLVCLVRDTNKCIELSKRPSCKVVQISYDDPNTLSIALRGIQTVIFVPEIEPQRVDWSDRMVDAMAKEQVMRCVTISSIGTDASDKDQLDRFRRVEDRIKKDIRRWTILREGFPFQALFYWVPMVHDQGVLGMPIKRDIEFAPLDITDLGHALISVTFPCKHPHRSDDNNDDDKTADEVQKRLSTLELVEGVPVLHVAGPGDGIERYDGQTYTLTGPETVTGPKLADELTRALQKDKKDKQPEPITFKELTRQEFREYLLALRNKPGETVPMAGGGFQPVASFLKILQHMTEAVKGVHHHQPAATATAEESSSAQAQPPVETGQSAVEGNDEVYNGDLIEIPSDEDGYKSSKRGHGPELEAPNDTEVDLVLELLDYINEGRATFQSGDLLKITGDRGNDAKAFFEKHGRDFRQRSPQSTATPSSSSGSTVVVPEERE
ncbi:hypothetical protein BGX23_012602 [Mortierella sp. AD031]|nr:hypothetical protein BGX23_012602 [Mortierella sp. AD031]